MRYESVRLTCIVCSDCSAKLVSRYQRSLKQTLNNRLTFSWRWDQIGPSSKATCASNCINPVAILGLLLTWVPLAVSLTGVVSRGRPGMAIRFLYLCREVADFVGITLLPPSAVAKIIFSFDIKRNQSLPSISAITPSRSSQLYIKPEPRW